MFVLFNILILFILLLTLLSILLLLIIPLFSILLTLVFISNISLLLFILLSSLLFSPLSSLLLFIIFSSLLFSLLLFCSLLFSLLLFPIDSFSFSSSSSSLIDSLSTSSPKIAIHNPSTSHCTLVIFFNSVFITTGSSSVSSSIKITVPILKAIIKCFFSIPPSLLSSSSRPHHTISAISRFFILSFSMISPTCLPALVSTNIFSFFFEIKILSPLGEYSINLVSSSKLLNQVFLPSTVPEYM